MELTRLKGRLRTAQRGHKLLKDKRDELMKQFMEVVREDLALRQKVEQSLARAYGSFTVASALMSPEMLEQALLCPKQSVSLETGTENVMSVEVPRYDLSVFSRCIVQQDCLQTPLCWKDIHPDLVTIPCDWDYSLAYGFHYAKDPSPAVQEFLRFVRQIAETEALHF